MDLDVPTLMLAGAFVASFSGALLLFAWYLYRETSAALWWGAADAALACAIVFMAVGAANGHRLLFLAGLTLLCVSSAFSWAGSRSFDGRRIHPVLLIAGTVVWLAAQGLPKELMTPSLSALVNAGVTLAYYAGGAFSIMRGKGEALRARLPFVVLLWMHALTLLIAVPASLTMKLMPNEPPPVMSWFGIIHFETIVFAIGTALFLVAMMKERSEGRHVDASYTDPLTGLLNRRGFLLRAERVLDRAGRDSVPVAVIVFDLDRFKAINDKFGHGTGDRVLQVYAEVCHKVLRPSDVIGRIGGEEFTVILPGFGVEAGLAMAERVRKAFEQAAAVIDGQPVNGTVCGGVTAGASSQDIHELLKQADSALYLAKDRGRNRIERGHLSSGDPALANVIRVA